MTKITRMVRFTIHDYMDMYPQYEWRYVQGKSLDDVKRKAYNFARYMNNAYSGGTTSFDKILNKQEALSVWDQYSSDHSRESYYILLNYYADEEKLKMPKLSREDLDRLCKFAKRVNMPYIELKTCYFSSIIDVSKTPEEALGLYLCDLDGVDNIFFYSDGGIALEQFEITENYYGHVLQQPIEVGYISPESHKELLAEMTERFKVYNYHIEDICSNFTDNI